jgi:speckle-type POZ protein
MASSSTIVAGAMEGSHVLKIEGYSRTKALSNGKYIKSDTFDVGGHSWSILYYPDGNCSKAAGRISFFLGLQRPSGAIEVEASFKFSLLDETGEPVRSYTKVCSIIRTFKTTDLGWGYDGFIEKKALEESNYLKDDCFRVRCDVIVSRGFRTEASRHQFVAVPPSNLSHHLAGLLSSNHGADVTFEVAGEVFTAHRNILAARSPVFMPELFGPMKEKATSRIRIDDIEARVFQAMLHFIYTDSLPPEMEKSDDMSVMMAQHLLVVADRYDLERLKLMCEDKLCNSIDASTAATTLALAEQHGCRGLKAACFDFLKSADNLKATMASDGFDHLITSCPSLIKELLLAKVAASP